MKKSILILLTAAISVLLSGCIMKSVSELYALPEQSAEYRSLQSALSQTVSGSTEYSSPINGANQQPIQMADLDGDGLIELPSTQKLQKFNQEDPRDYYLVNWYNLDADGRKIANLTTYYNDTDGWYLVIPDTWEGNLLVRYGDDESGYAGYGFYLYQTEPSDARLVATVYMFAGTDARTLAESDGRFVLNQKGDLVFSAKLGSAADLTEAQLQELFRFIQVQWFTGEM